MKVLHINDIALVPSQLIKSLRKKGIDADLLDYKLRTKYKGIKPIFCNKFLSILKYPVNLDKYDIIHLHYPINILGITTILRCRKRNLIVHLHGTDARSSKNSFISRIIMKMVAKKSKIFLYSTPNLKTITKKFKKASYHFPNPIDTKYFKPSNVKKNNKVLMISALIKWKKPEIALNAANELKNIQFDALYYGPQKDKEYYRKWESDNIHFIGPFNYDKLVKTILKYPLIIGQFSGEIGVMELQAMSSGKPVIMYSKYKIPVLNAKTSKDVVRVIKKNMKNTTLGKKARKWVIYNHDTDIIADKLIKIYKEL